MQLWMCCSPLRMKCPVVLMMDVRVVSLEMPGNTCKRLVSWQLRYSSLFFLPYLLQCYPYSIPTCPPQQQPCLNFVNTPPCVQQCVDGETWSKSKHYTKSTYGVGPDASEIQQEIFTNGPVEACFSVYEDFLSYKSGVYQVEECWSLLCWPLSLSFCSTLVVHTLEGTASRSLDGVLREVFHIGWSTTAGPLTGVTRVHFDFLLLGFQRFIFFFPGQFKILRGQDECGIEDQVVAGMPHY